MDDKCIVFISVYASESPVVVIRCVLPFQLYLSHFQLRSCQPDYEERFQNREMMSEEVINIFAALGDN